MISYILVFLFQFMFQYFRIVGTIANVKLDIWKTFIYTIIIQALWFASTYLSILSSLKEDYYIVILYLLGGGLGSVAGIYYLKLTKKM